MTAPAPRPGELRKSFTESERNSVSSESFSTVGENISDEVIVSETNSLQIRGYLLKKSKEGAWQKRFFETNGNYLTYYKSRKMSKLLAALNLAEVGEISVVNNICSPYWERLMMCMQLNEVDDLLGPGVIFQLELKDKSYLLRARTMQQAKQWMNVLKLLKAQNEPNPPAVPDQTQSRQPMSANLVKDIGASDSGTKRAQEQKSGCCTIS
jgi:hypothetical protein